MKTVQYTCNKKSHPVLKEDCKSCSEYNPCAKDGKWCFVGALVAEHDPIMVEGAMPCGESAASSILRDTTSVTIHCGDGMSFDILKVEEQLKRSFYKSTGLGLMFGA